MESEILNYVSMLFKEFGYWSIAMVCATTLLMIPLNWVIKKLFSKCTNDAAVRVGKVLSQVLVFGVSAVCITLCCLITKTKLSAGFVFANVLPCGFLAMVLWGVIKVIRDMGIKPIIKLVLESNTAKNLLKKIDLDSNVKNTIYKTLVELLKNSDGVAAELVIDKETELVKRAEEMLKGFTDQPNALAKQFAEVLKTKYSKKEK